MNPTDPREELKIEAHRFYKTRDGRKVRVYATDGDGRGAIHAAVLNGPRWEEFGSWEPDGRASQDPGEHMGDIVAEWDGELTETESTNSNLAAEIAELKEEIKDTEEHFRIITQDQTNHAIELGRIITTLRAELEAARKERDEVCKELEAQVETTHTALAAKDAALAGLRDIDRAIAGFFWTSDDGQTLRDAEPEESGAPQWFIETWKGLRILIAALAPAPTQEPPACPKCFGTGWIRQVGGKLKCECKQEPPAGGVVESKNDYPGVELGSAIINVDTGELVSPADVPSEGRGEWMPFNLSNALAGKPVVTRDGRAVDNIQKGTCPMYSVVGFITGARGTWTDDGQHVNGCTHPLDLFMLPTEGSGATNEIGLRAEDLEGSV